LTLAEHLSIAVRTAINETFAAEVQEIVAKETRVMFRNNHERFEVIIRNAVQLAMSEILSEGNMS
jgi:hypothetical protein